MGLSCEIPSEQTSIECIKFYNEQRLKELELQIKALTEMYKDLSCNVAGLSDHRIRQIDENRKISRRVDEIKLWGDSHLSCWNLLDEKILALSERIEKLDQYMKKGLQKQINDIIGLFTKGDLKLEDEIDELARTVNAIKESYNSLCASSIRREPFKCPVCDGKGEIHNKKLAEKDYQIAKKGDLVNYITECNSCEGKGILWG